MSRFNYAIASGLALFSMFFGAGNAIFPFLIGAVAKGESLYAILGFLFAGVLVPFLGLVALMLYGGDNKAFFGRIGKRAGFWLFALLIALLGPLGSMPRLLTVSYDTLQPYLLGMGLPLFSLLACAAAFLITYRKGRVIGILGVVLTPLLLLALGAIIVAGLSTGPVVPQEGVSSGAALWEGMHWGYSLLDMVAAFLYSAVVLNGFRERGADRPTLIWQMSLASGLAGGLLCLVYGGLIVVGAWHVPAGAEVEGIVRTVCMELLGPWGGVVASVAVGLACLTTVISLTTVCSEFVREEFVRRRHLPTLIILGISFALSNLGFSGIARFIGPILDVIHPALILLCVVNIGLKLYEPIRLRQVRQLRTRSSPEM